MVHLDRIEKLGAVLFKLYGQACDKCGTDDETTFYPRCGIRIRSSRHRYLNFQNVYFINNAWKYQITESFVHFKRLKLFYGVFQKCGTRGLMFWVHLDTIEKLGAVLFKLYGQACDECGTDD